MHSFLLLCSVFGLSAASVNDDAAAEHAAIVAAVLKAEVDVASILRVDHATLRDCILKSQHGVVSVPTLVFITSAPGWEDGEARTRLWPAWGQLLQAHRLFDSAGHCEASKGNAAAFVSLKDPAL